MWELCCKKVATKFISFIAAKCLFFMLPQNVVRLECSISPLWLNLFCQTCTTAGLGGSSPGGIETTTNHVLCGLRRELNLGTMMCSLKSSLLSGRLGLSSTPTPYYLLLYYSVLHLSNFARSYADHARAIICAPSECF